LEAISVTNDPTAEEVRAGLQLIDEDVAAESLEVSPKTLRKYRMRGIGPRYTVVARKIQYTPAWLKDWVLAGGTRNIDP
jgi:hypothetical protein